MVFIGRCIPCQYGRHDQHYRVIRDAGPDVIGGAVCGCEGECVEDYANPKAKIDRDVAEIMKRYEGIEI